MISKVGYDAIVVEQRVIHVEQEYDLVRRCHVLLSLRPPTSRFSTR
jgi:hypothetical protein